MHGEGAVRGQRPGVGVLALVDVVLVDLVGEDPEIVTLGPGGQSLDDRPRDHLAGRVARRIEVEGDRALRQMIAHHLHRALRRVGDVEEGDLDRHAVERADDARDERPVGRQHQHLVAGLDDGAGHRPQAAGGAGRHQDVLALGRHAGAPPRLVDDGIEQRPRPLRRRIAVHAGPLGHRQVLHAAAGGRLHPGIADVQRIDLAGEAGQTVGKRRVDGARDVGDGGREVRMAGHGEAMLPHGHGALE